MRKIGAVEILLFLALLLLILGLTWLTAAWLFHYLPPGDFRGILSVASGIFLLYAYALLVYRSFLSVMPLKEGEIAPGSKDEVGYHVYLLFYLILFYPLMRGGFIPVPLMRLIYQALGARLGENTYSSGIILDPPLVDIGANTIVGQYALLVPHVIEGERLAHYRIRIGNNVTIGAHAVVLSGVTIGDNAIVATGAIVSKNSRIEANEVWGGIPARRLRTGNVAN
jgi:hypothetical protein